MDITKELHREIIFVSAGKYRSLVILTINDKFKTATDISKSAKIPMRETNRELKKLKIIKLLKY